MPLEPRPFAGPSDVAVMIELLLAVRPPDRISHWPGVVELHEVLARPAVTTNTRLWEDEIHRVAAWAFVDEFDNIHFESSPSGMSEADFAAMFEWAGSIVAGRSGEGEHHTLDASAHDGDPARVALLLRHGFVEQPEKTLHYARSLVELVPPPRLPSGFYIRPLREAEEGDVAALHRAAFGTEHMTVENRRAMMAGPEYDPEGDLVVVAPDGQLAAYTMASISPTENAVSGRADGFTDPVATHPEFRRLGLATAVMLAGCAHLRSRGAECARLGTSSENLAMQRAAESAGYRLDHSARWFTRKVIGP